MINFKPSSLKWGGKVNKISMLVFANIRKTKGHTVSLFIMFLIAALLLNAGLLVYINFGGFFDNTIKELNTSNIYYIIPSDTYNSEVEDLITNNKNVIEMQKEESLWATAVTEYNDDTREEFFLLSDADNIRNMSKWKFVGEHLPSDAMSVYVPYRYKQDGYKLNDEFKMSFKDATITFTIKGFIEDIFFSASDTGVMGIYLPHDTYEMVSSELNDTCKATVIFANLKHINKEVETEIRELTKASEVSSSSDITKTIFSLDLAIIKLSRVMMASMVSVMIVAFAIIIVAVCLIVVIFRIGNSIEDDMTKIGSLKAIGYTCKQIVLSIVMQFGLIAFAGSIAGIALSYLATPLLSDVFAKQSGLLWVQGFDGSISSIALCLLLIIVVIVAFFAARRINKLHPIVALRGGIITHSFYKNHIPLSTSKGSLPIVLALKSLLQNKKQGIMISIILIAVSFAGTFAVVMFYNTTIDTKTFFETPGVELSNAVAIIKPDSDTTKFLDNIENWNEVRKVQFIDQAMVSIDKNQIIAYVMEDYSSKETNSVYQGRYPLHSNEIVLAGHLAEMIEKKIGDSVTVKIGDTQADFIITGLSQGAYMGGMNVSIQLDGMIKLNPDFKQQSLQIYLNKNENADEIVQKIKTLYGDVLMSATDMDKIMEQGTGVYIAIVSKVGIAILVVTILVVILVLYFVINSSVTRRKRELGIQKAIGFTTFQLMNQLSFGFLPPIIVGVCIGSMLGIMRTNAIMSVAQRAMSIMKANYIITPGWIALFGVAIVIVSYVTSMLITYRIRKISAYALVSE